LLLELGAVTGNIRLEMWKFHHHGETSHGAERIQCKPEGTNQNTKVGDCGEPKPKRILIFLKSPAASTDSPRRPRPE
jgi:hypothetical protein